jgi:hypothetical protein
LIEKTDPQRFKQTKNTGLAEQTPLSKRGEVYPSQQTLSIEKSAIYCGL